MKNLYLLAVLFFAFTFSFAQPGVGIGTNSPKSKMDIKGGLTVGDSYAGINAAPTDGAIIQGNVGVGTSSPNSKAALDVTSTTQGVLLPRMTTAQRNGITGLGVGHKGLTIFNTDNNRTEFWDGSTWKAVGEGAGGPPTGSAGGDLTGTYPNPTIAPGAVNGGTGGDIADGTITTVDLATPAVNATNQIFNTLPVGNGGTGTSSTPANGQILIGNGSNYNVANISGGTGISIANGPGSISVTNTAPDQTVTLSNGGNISVTGGYPNFTLATNGGTLSGGTPNYMPKWTSATALSSTSLIYDNGTNVGIGTTSPADKLHINGGSIRLNDIAGATPYEIRSYGSGSSLWFISGAATTASRIVLGTGHDWDRQAEVTYTPNTTGGGAGHLEIGQLNKNNANYTHGITSFYTNGLERIRINSNGNVGIGTSPASRLDVVGGTTSSFPILRVSHDMNGGETGIRFRTQSSGGANAHSDISWTATGTETGNLVFRVPYTNERMRIQSDGNIGIGTSNPGSYRLNVQQGGLASIFESTLDAPLEIKGTDGWSGLRMSDNANGDYIFYNGTNSTFAIGGGGSNVSGKKLHIDGGTTIGSSFDAISPPSNGVGIEGTVRIAGGSPAAGYVLTSTDASGNAVWKDPSKANAVYTGSVTAGNWYRIAINNNGGGNPGDRANAFFTLRDYISSGGHSTVNFRIGTSYNYTPGMSFTLLNHSYYVQPTFTKLRVLTNTTYDVQYLEVYVNRTGSVDLTIDDNIQSVAWTPVSWTAGSIPGGYTASEFELDKLFNVGNNDDKFTVDRSGNVGVGTTAPNSKTEIVNTVAHSYPTPGLTYGTLNIAPASSAVAGNSASITFGASQNVSGAQAGIYVQSSGSYGTKMYFGTTNSYATGSQSRMMIDADGRVGIGTVSPNELLEINGSVRGNISGALRISTGHGYVDVGPQSSSWMHFYTDRGRYYFDKGMSVDQGLIGSYDEDLQLQTSGTTRIYASNSTGNVGIGTTSPSKKLQVTGGSATQVSILTDGLVEDIGGIIRSNHIPSRSWTLTSGSVGIFNDNGGSGDNVREWGDNPHGERSILWKCQGTGTDADGGWNTSQFLIDNTKSYRFSVWVKRTHNTGGDTYVGALDDNLALLNGTYQSNPYFYYGKLPVANRWYLIVGYIHGKDDASTTSLGGIYDGTTGQKVTSFTGGANGSTDYKFTSSSTQQQQRAYLYYNNTAGLNQFFWDPRVEEINGTEPSISSMLPRNVSNSNCRVCIYYCDGNCGVTTSGSIVKRCAPMTPGSISPRLDLLGDVDDNDDVWLGYECD